MRIGLLGTLAVCDEAGRPVRVGGSRVRLLLILLALDAGRVVPAYSLIERLWDGDPPANAANSLQSLVSRLRAALRQGGLGGAVIESHPAGYRLAVPPDAVDVVAFEARARAGSQALAAGDPAAARRALAEALAAWRGPALADALGARFAEGPAARLEELRTRATLDLIEAGLALGESEGLIGELRAVIAADPVAERPRGLLMRALYAAGRQAEALAVYGQTRELLAGRLGVDPSPQLERIYLGVLRQDLDEPKPAPKGHPLPDTERSEPRAPAGSAVTPRPASLRKPLTSFVGRDEDVTRVLKMLAEGRLVTLTGPGGAGKTRLAVETAARLAGEPLAGAPATAGDGGEAPPVWFVELAPVARPGDVPYAVLHMLGIRESPVLGRGKAGQHGEPADPVGRLLTALAGRRGLLILDNCEHVVAAAAALADRLLTGCPGVRVLATSREPLRIDGEALWPVLPLPVPPAATDGGAAGYASVRLLADRAAAVRPDFAVTAANAADVARICRALDGMPLAIELAAAWLRTLSAAQLAERLDARFELLTGGRRTAVPRHQTLRAVVDWSWDLLSGPEQVLARRLAVFPGGATLPAAEQVCGGDPALPADAVLPTLFGLVEKSFLTVASDGEPRYRMLETVRAYCAQRLAEAGEEDQVRREFAAYFLDLAETADRELRGPGQHAWMGRLTAEQDNAHAALRWAIDRRDPVLALRFGQALAWFWLLRGRRHESAALARDILAVSGPAGLTHPADDGLDVVNARAVCALTVLNASWDIAEVRQPLLDAAATARAAEPGRRPPHPFAVIGVVMLEVYENRDPDAALRALAAQFESADPWLRAGARAMHAFFSMSLGRMDGVASDCAGALEGFEAIGDRWGRALALMGKAELASLDGDHPTAIAALEEAVVLTRELSDWEDTTQMHAQLAKSRSRMGDFAGAAADMERAEQMARGQAEPESALWVSYIRAEQAWLQGDFAEVSSICRRLDGWMAGKPAQMSWSFRALLLTRGGLAELRSGNTGRGRATLASALRLARDGQDLSVVAAVMDGLAAAELWGGDDRASAERAATMLGAAHSVRGAFDHSSLDAPVARDTARRILGAGAFEAAYGRGRVLGYPEALALAGDLARHPAGT